MTNRAVVDVDEAGAQLLEEARREEALKKEALLEEEAREEEAGKEEAEKEERPPWCRFCVVWVACSFSAGILPGQAVFTRLFAEAGIFASACEEGESGCKDQFVTLTGIFQGAMALTLFLLLPIGLMFDRLGARAVGTIGALICALGMFMVVGSILGAQSGLDSSTSLLFSLGLLITDFGSFLNSFATFGLVWHFPGRQTLFLALITATYQVSAFFPLVIDACMKHLGMTLVSGIAGWGVIVIIMAYVCWVSIPSQQEYYDQAKKILGMPLPKPHSDVQICKLIRRAWEVLRLDTRDHVLCGVALTLGYALPGVYQGLAAPFGTALFGSKEDGDKVSNVYVWLNGILGCSAAPASGMFVDRFGFNQFVYFLLFLEVGASSSLWFADWTCQIVCMSCLVLWALLFQLFINRYLLMYSPPNRIGAVQGVFYAIVCTCLTMPVQLTGIGVISALPKGVDSYRLPFLIFGVAGSITLAAYAVYINANPPPETPRLLGDDEKELAKNFGCENLEEVAYVTHIATKKEVMAKLAKQDADSIRDIIKSIDTERMMEMMNRRSVEDIAEMMEEAGEEEEEEEALGGEGGYVPAKGDPEDDAEKGDDSKDTTAPEDDPVRELAGRLDGILKEKDKEGMRKSFMEEDVELLDKVFIYWEENLPDAEMKRKEKEFNKLIPPKEFAGMLRERKDLKKLVQNMMKRAMDKKIAKFRGKKNPANVQK